MTYHEYCRDQIGRFAGRRGWPDPDEYPDAVKDLIGSLERAARDSKDFAKRVVDLCVESSAFCPAVPDILRVAAELRDRDSTGPKQGLAGCDVCEHTGFVRFTRQVGGVPYDYSRPCTACRSAAPEPPHEVKPAHARHEDLRDKDWAHRAARDA